MSSNQSNESAPNTEFVLKHRISGAAFLLFFGALILPLLLGAPSQATKSQNAKPSANEAVLSADELVDELINSNDLLDEAVEEQVYISKITPLNGAAQEQDKAIKKQIKTEQKPAEQPSKLDKKSPPIVKQATQKSPEKIASTSSKAQNKAEKITIGWVVQVGLYEDVKGAEKIYQNLQKNGLQPSKSLVDTNKGKNMATRVWLGPFAQRVEAAKAKTRLSQKTGQAGFIRAYP